MTKNSEKNFTEEEAWDTLSSQSFFEGYAEKDVIYDNSIAHRITLFSSSVLTEFFKLFNS